MASCTIHAETQQKSVNTGSLDNLTSKLEGKHHKTELRLGHLFVLHACIFPCMYRRVMASGMMNSYIHLYRSMVLQYEHY